jgi:hypothetical protein
MTGTKPLLDTIQVDLNDLTVYIDVYDNSLSRKWLSALNHLLANDYHLEKNYSFFGFAQGARNGCYILDQVNRSIAAINQANLGYSIDDHFTMDNCITNEPVDGRVVGRNLIHDRMNHLHRYFEDLQGVSGALSPYYVQANTETRWHIRQLNLLCHEFESWAMSWRKEIEAPEWQRPSQLMCWLNAPRFTLDAEDYELFGIETINRPLGGVFVGVNKAVGKHHWEVFTDEGRDSRLNELTTTTLRSQTQAAGDFDIEWANNPGEYEWQRVRLAEFREWLVDNGFDPEDRGLTIGHPQVAQVDLVRTFGTKDYQTIWAQLSSRLNVSAIRTSSASNTFPYHWNDDNYMQLQIERIQKGN